MGSIEQLLGRKYRLVLELSPGMLHGVDAEGRGLRVPASAYCNEPPAPGTYMALVALASAQAGQLPTELCSSSCQPVTVTAAGGIEVERVHVPEALRHHHPYEAAVHGAGVYLLVDFDTCHL